MDITERFVKRRWGIFNHFLYSTPGGTDGEYSPPGDGEYWCKLVESFDTDALAERVHKTGAGYYFITIMQGTRYLIAPNITFDKICGTKPGEACAKRDLINDLYESLAKYDIDLCLYYTGDGPWKDKICGSKMGFGNPRTKVTEKFVKNWSSVLEEYAVRYGNKIKAWWIDGCYGEYFGYTQEYMKYYYDAVKKGNPTALVTMNNGVFPEPVKWYENEDYTAGEFEALYKVPVNAPFIDGARIHILAPLGYSNKKEHFYAGWRQRGVQCNKEFLKNYIKTINSVGGFVTIDIFVDEIGQWDEEQFTTITGI